MAFTAEMRQKAQETRERKRRERLAEQERDAATSELGTFAGVGESKPFIAPPGAFEREIDITQCHLNGKLIADLNFTPEQVALIAFKNTDEGIAAFAEERPKTQFEKDLATYYPPTGDRDGVDWDSPDLLKDAAKPFEKPGFDQRFLGEARCNEAGLRRWVPVKDKRGNLVRVGRGLFLGERPESVSAAQRAANRAKTEAQQREIGEDMQVQQERFVRDGGLTLKPGEILHRGSNPNAAVQEGLHIRRGNTSE